jgi:hypothetical protein
MATPFPSFDIYIDGDWTIDSDYRIDHSPYLNGPTPIAQTPARATIVTAPQSLANQVITSPTRPTQITG